MWWCCVLLCYGGGCGCCGCLVVGVVHYVVCYSYCVLYDGDIFTVGFVIYTTWCMYGVATACDVVWWGVVWWYNNKVVWCGVMVW